MLKPIHSFIAWLLFIELTLRHNWNFSPICHTILPITKPFRPSNTLSVSPTFPKLSSVFWSPPQPCRFYEPRAYALGQCLNACQVLRETHVKRKKIRLWYPIRVADKIAGSLQTAYFSHYINQCNIELNLAWWCSCSHLKP